MSYQFSNELCFFVWVWGKLFNSEVFFTAAKVDRSYLKKNHLYCENLMQHRLNICQKAENSAQTQTIKLKTLKKYLFTFLLQYILINFNFKNVYILCQTQYIFNSIFLAS
jgi:hypothetical protein